MASKHKPDQQLELTEILQAHIPGARAEKMVLPQCGGLSLYLLNADYPQSELSAEQMLKILNYPAYWAFCWASGVVLARFLLSNPEWVKDKRVLDFGTGSGVAAIAAAHAGARQVIACDIDPDAQRATQFNCKLNGVSVDVRGDFDEIGDVVDIILVADVLYDRENLPWLARFIERAPEVLVADSRVRNFEFPHYRKLGEYESSTLPDLDEFDEYRRVSVYRGGYNQKD